MVGTMKIPLERQSKISQIGHLIEMKMEKIWIDDAQLIDVDFSELNSVKCPLKNERAVLLGRLLEQNTHVKSVLLHDNDIGDEGACAIGTMLKFNSTIVHIDLYGNNVGDFGAMTIADALYGHMSLEYLGLWENLITDRGAIALASAVQSNSSLTYLGLVHNNISDKGANALLNSIQGNTNLEILNLAGNDISQSIVSKIGSTLAENRLRAFSLRRNDDQRFNSSSSRFQQDNSEFSCPSSSSVPPPLVSFSIASSSTKESLDGTVHFPIEAQRQRQRQLQQQLQLQQIQEQQVQMQQRQQLERLQHQQQQIQQKLKEQRRHQQQLQKQREQSRFEEVEESLKQSSPKNKYFDSNRNTNRNRDLKEVIVVDEMSSYTLSSPTIECNDLNERDLFINNIVTSIIEESMSKNHQFLSSIEVDEKSIIGPITSSRVDEGNINDQCLSSRVNEKETVLLIVQEILDEIIFENFEKTQEFSLNEKSKCLSPMRRREIINVLDLPISKERVDSFYHHEELDNSNYGDDAQPNHLQSSLQNPFFQRKSLSSLYTTELGNLTKQISGSNATTSSLSLSSSSSMLSSVSSSSMLSSMSSSMSSSSLSSLSTLSSEDDEKENYYYNDFAVPHYEWNDYEENTWI